ncbi:MAG: EamA family transporter [Oscillospiraceae bacterium]|nr:EamA family transporter [Oscillospiraceae bacterium]
MSFYWPILLIVLSNVFYHICTKSTPGEINPFASLTVTYLVGALLSLVLYFTLNRQGNLAAEFRHLNWVPFVLGIAIVGLEGGYIYLYKVGWSISTGQIIASILLAFALLVIGLIFYHEAITWTKVLGIAICMLGLYFINK